MKEIAMQRNLVKFVFPILGVLFAGLLLFSYVRVTRERTQLIDDLDRRVKFLVNTTARDWMTQDAGIWEFRHRKAHFTFSKVLSWVSLDRGVKIAERLGKDYAVANWKRIADQIRSDIEEKGWNRTVGSFTQSYGSEHLDVSLLLMERYRFLDKDDPRWIATVRSSEKTLLRNGLAFRYTNADDFGKPKNAFLLASLWLAKALYGIGERDKARCLFEKVLSHANPLGLLSEDIDIETGELLGNFPQAFSHMALINTANLLSTS